MARQRLDLNEDFVARPAHFATGTWGTMQKLQTLLQPCMIVTKAFTPSTWVRKLAVVL